MRLRLVKCGGMVFQAEGAASGKAQRPEHGGMFEEE